MIAHFTIAFFWLLRIVPQSLYKQALPHASKLLLSICSKVTYLGVKLALTSGKSLAVSVLNITVITYLALFLDEILICLLLEHSCTRIR
ncbi:hypothetical protein O9992_28840 [Vibrio lentus]|nr:hypothetical protein [Vibrio lentus]